jgi:Arc/MetJ family transcription regulator
VKLIPSSKALREAEDIAEGAQAAQRGIPSSETNARPLEVFFGFQQRSQAGKHSGQHLRAPPKSQSVQSERLEIELDHLLQAKSLQPLVAHQRKTQSRALVRQLLGDRNLLERSSKSSRSTLL